MPRIQFLLFDLDDTLYTGASGLFKEVGRRIEVWTAKALGLSLPDARALKQHYYTTYGTTMAGLLHEHPEVDIEDYLAYVHQVDVTQYLQPNPELDAMLSRLPAHKYIFTNSVSEWAERVTHQLGIRHHFERIFDVRASGYRGKPHPHAYRHVLSSLGQPGQACVLLDDQVSYLTAAAQAGMHTVLVRPGGAPTDGVDFAVDHILDAEITLKRLLSST